MFTSVENSHYSLNHYAHIYPCPCGARAALCDALVSCVVCPHDVSVRLTRALQTTAPHTVRAHEKINTESDTGACARYTAALRARAREPRPSSFLVPAIVVVVWRAERDAAILRARNWRVCGSLLESYSFHPVSLALTLGL